MRHRFLRGGSGPGLVCVAALAVVAAGCSSSTTLLVTVDVQDTSVPRFTQLIIKISSVADPSHEETAMFISTNPGYGAEGGLPPVIIPGQYPFTLEPSYLSGEVLVEAEGVEIYGGTVVARGSAMVNVVANTQTQVTVTLHGLGSCAAGTSDGGATDAAATCDGGDAGVSGGG